MPALRQNLFTVSFGRPAHLPDGITASWNLPSAPLTQQQLHKRNYLRIPEEVLVITGKLRANASETALDKDLHHRLERNLEGSLISA